MMLLLVWILTLLLISLRVYFLMEANHNVVMEYLRSPLGEERDTLADEMYEAQRRYSRWVNILFATALIPAIFLFVLSLIY